MDNQNWLAFMVPLLIGGSLWWASQSLPAIDGVGAQAHLHPGSDLGLVRGFAAKIEDALVVAQHTKRAKLTV